MVSAIFALITDTSSDATLKQVLCIWYLVQFHRKNDKDIDKKVRALIESGNEVNVIYPVYITKLGLHTRKINVSI